MSKKICRKNVARVAAAASMALAAGAANANTCPVDGCEGIGDYVWLDANMDGIQNTGESGLPGVTVNLLFGDGSPTGLSDLTDGSGNYEIRFDSNTDFSAQTTFIIEFILNPGYKFSPRYQGGDTSKDSDADPITGQSGIITIAATTNVIQDDFTIDAGMYVPVPAAAWLFGSGLLGLVGIARRKKVA